MEERITIREVLGTTQWKRGFIKCRLIHMDGRSVVQPDVLLLEGFRKGYFVPKFFDPCQLGFWDDADQSFCRFTMVVAQGAVFRVGFFQNDKLQVYPDASVIYRCCVSLVEGQPPFMPDGEWRRRGDAFQLRVYHHTNAAGFKGISESREVWGSKWNIQGNRALKNVAYGYFTSLAKIKSAEDLHHIAMSSSGLAGLIPTNAPYHPRYAKVIGVPKQEPAERGNTLPFWVDIALLAPHHLWLHRPMSKPAYYEIVLPAVLRIGVLPGAAISFSQQVLHVAGEQRKWFKYVVVGDADTFEGLHAPYHEEETTEVALIEEIAAEGDIISRWKALANTDQFNGKTVEYVEMERIEGE